MGQGLGEHAPTTENGKREKPHLTNSAPCAIMYVRTQGSSTAYHGHSGAGPAKSI
jgi:hypothetical protein